MNKARNSPRDNFTETTKLKLAARAGHRCSNPQCRAQTSGPQLAEEMSVNIGVAAHITAAASGGPRYNPSLTERVRSGITNGIWLCQTCAKLIDSDVRRYTEQTLRSWKKSAENEAHQRIGKARARSHPSNEERALKRDLKLRDQMKRDLLKPWDQINRERSRDGDRGVNHPYAKFRHSEVIIHRVGDDVYPGVDNSPGISSWFKVEMFDFYHKGIKVILGLESGVIENDLAFAGNLQWAFTPYQIEFDLERFRKINIFTLGLIPFRNIRHYDLQGDEYYNSPHIYCAFSINDMPYAGFEYAVAGVGEYDWPLSAELQLETEAVRPQSPELGDETSS